jgi:hypothetical protein
MNEVDRDRIIRCLENLNVRLQSVELLTESLITGMNERNKILANMLALPEKERQILKDEVARNESDQEQAQAWPNELRASFSELLHLLKSD